MACRQWLGVATTLTPTAELSGLVGRVNVEFSGTGAGSFPQLSALVKYQRILREFNLDCEFSFETFGEALYPFDPDLAAIRRLVEDDLTRGCGGCFTATDPH